MPGPIILVLLVAWSAEPPVSPAARVEEFLHQGEFARGEHALSMALRNTPEDDHLRFGLGVLQFVHGVERLGQALHEYGCRSENSNMPFVRLPVPDNPDPTPITYAAFRRVLDGFYTDLATAEATLAGITDHRVALKLRLADVQLDLIGDRKSPVRLSELLTKMMGRRPPVLVNNPDFQVRFDRGDVAWLRAYCHLLMAMIDAQLACDLEQQFNLTANELFANPKHTFQGTDKEKLIQLQLSRNRVPVKDPARLGRFREHMLQVCRLNHETWTYIRAEQDNDFEWLPNPRQTGVLGLPVTEAMISAWLGMVDEMEALFEGQRKIPAWLIGLISSATKEGLNLKLVLVDPPTTFDWERISKESIREKYLDPKLPDINLQAFIRVGSVFQNSLGVAYGAWFN